MNFCQYPQYPYFMNPMFNQFANQNMTPENYPALPNEESYIENILRLNLGKPVSIYMNFENSQWGSKIFKGILEAAGKDHIIISDKDTNMRYLLLTIYLNYVTFDEEINYYYPYRDNPAK